MTTNLNERRDGESSGRQEAEEEGRSKRSRMEKTNDANCLSLCLLPISDSMQLSMTSHHHAGLKNPQTEASKLGDILQSCRLYSQLEITATGQAGRMAEHYSPHFICFLPEPAPTGQSGGMGSVSSLCYMGSKGHTRCMFPWSCLITHS